jgi:Enoyl-CoA hydratase/isomerase
MRFHGQAGDPLDLNRSYRNVTLADTIHCYSDYAADGAELWVNKDLKLEDPSLEVDDLAWHEDRTSDLVDFAATYADILREPTMVGLYERLYEVAAADQDGLDDEERLVANAAKEFCRRMAAASPLALTVSHRLLQLGGRQSETWESCMDRERRVQTKLLQGADFRTWQATHRTGTQTKWTHSSLKDVTSDEVAELIDA